MKKEIEYGVLAFTDTPGTWFKKDVQQIGL